jgi:hypothetical protein
MPFLPLLLVAGTSMYGPIEVVLPISTTGNPFDPAVNDVRVSFKSKSGKTAERIAFYSHGKWEIKGYLPEPGTYSGTVTVNGKSVGKIAAVLVPNKKPSDMILTDGKWFKKSNGEPYWPVGIDVAWGSGPTKPVESYFPQMKKAGMNWSRVWGCHWDDRNPYWTTNFAKPKDNWMSEDALDRWDKVIKGAETNGIHFQFVCFHHGMFSSSVNPNWQDHPWNAKNGGFLKSASDFFSDPEAKRRTKMLLRYFVARYGYSTSIMAWELFNEVQFVDRVRVKQDWETVGKWHDEMAQYVRSIDTNRHLITTSSELDKPIWNQTDYIQGHGYPSSVAGMLSGTPNPGPKPMFFGEIGPGSGGAEESKAARREGFWSALFAGHAGAGQYWYWDQMTDDAFKEYAFFNTIMRILPPARTFKPQDVKLRVPTGGDLVIRPGRGWQESSMTSFNLPEDAAAIKTGQLSSYIQGDANRKMQPKPLTFSFDATTPGKLNMHAGSVSGGGAKLEVSINGTTALTKEFPGGTKPSDDDSNLSIPFAVGHNEIVINNIGADWINIDKFTFTGIAPLASIQAIRSGNWVLVYVHTLQPHVKIELSNFGTKSAVIAPTMWEIGALTKSQHDLERKDGWCGCVPPGRDTILMFES